jgi:hypothetical protein
MHTIYNVKHSANIPTIVVSADNTQRGKCKLWFIAHTIDVWDKAVYCVTVTEIIQQKVTPLAEFLIPTLILPQ